MTARQALERIVELETKARIASDMPRHAVMAAIAKEALAAPDMTKLEALCKSTFLECAEDHLARIQAAAEPVREWLAGRVAAYTRMPPVGREMVQALLDAIGKPEDGK